MADITEIKEEDGKLYVFVIFNCFDAAVLGLAMDINMKESLCEQTLNNAVHSYPEPREAFIHSLTGEGHSILARIAGKRLQNMTFYRG